MKRSIGISLWFMFLTLPLMVVRVNTINNEIEWRWSNMLWVGLCAFALAWFWHFSVERRAARREEEKADTQPAVEKLSLAQRLADDPVLGKRLLLVAAVVALVFPWLVSTGQNFYHVNVMVSALIFVVLGLGLNITVGLAGLLDLGYIAFFAVGSYTYALLSKNFDLGFWTCLPLGGVMGMLFGIVLGFPILRLRGDYLAIVTLGFASITKIVLENWDTVFGGAAGIAGIPRPEFFGMALDGRQKSVYSYYIVLALVGLTILVTNRLKNSRIGRAWMALREDEIACVAMGVDMARTKLSAYALGAFWAGLVGVVFAAHNNFINPDSFTFMDSAMILAMVVLGGMGSILGVIIASLALKLLPEYLRAFAEYRMLVFGAVMVLMMIFRPQGLISNMRRKYEHDAVKGRKTDGSK
ncbi:MAG: high-affinity branched-chain amino acid ABC transporter permease LivM [Propionivibrio sp.]|nr:high-affinity branched-chain amino acid ABC transporter permease LivM [Propionivibrio sp.]MBP6711299.1 high-affinity branched-chain amino acid ABC transporter permease LivM [Propionivibrio sp.]